MRMTRLGYVLVTWHIVVALVAAAEAWGFARLAMQPEIGWGYALDLRTMVSFSIVPALFLALEVIIDGGEIA